ncbi:MAG: YafY family transcriptional regulator [Myxococcales bacterium]|nr:YafY family transcriptional regulator [Myxococcales bacterium]MCB9609654.1 YafY family transcriptional regulator [Polyangiaceae bacterium]
MAEPAARLLRLLALLQARRFWTATELAERLEITDRTVRRDVDRLRGLGYPVDASVGVAGGYQLGSGAVLPPLLLEDDEALAVTLGLRTAAVGSVTGVEEATLRALAKLEQVLPKRVRRKVQDLQGAVTSLGSAGAAVDAQVLSALAAAQRAHEVVLFAYTDGQGSDTQRRAEPHGLVHATTRWYLVAWDLDRADWRTFRVDRINGSVQAQHSFVPRAIPHGSPAAYVAHSVTTDPYPVQARVVVYARKQDVARRVYPGDAVLEPLGERCLMRVGARQPEVLAMHLAMLGIDFEVLEPPELIAAVSELGKRLTRAASASKRRARS